jgi:ribosomal protein S18 acetylase RimI-like enzyme
MRNLKKPIIAAVNGIAAGAGAMLMLASDLRIFSDKARAAFLFVKVGLSGADMGALYLLPRIVGLGKATELVYFGDTIDAQEAHRIGLANRVVPGDTLMDEAYKWANRLKDGPLYALGVTKELLEYEANVQLKPRWRWKPQPRRVHGNTGLHRGTTRSLKKTVAGLTAAEARSEEEMKKDIYVRNLEKRDLPAIVSMEERQTGVARPDYWEKRIEISEAIRPHWASLVAELDNRVVGFVLGRAGEFEFGLPGTVAWIEIIGVDPAYRRRGIAQELVEKFAESAEDHGIRTIFTLITSNQTEMQQFFSRLGFVHGKMLHYQKEISS